MLHSHSCRPVLRQAASHAAQQACCSAGLLPTQVEAKYPALLFKQQLDAFVQKIFPMLRDNIKKDVNPQLAACIHAPRARPAGHGGSTRTLQVCARARSVRLCTARGLCHPTLLPHAWAASTCSFLARSHLPRAACADNALSPHWGAILATLHNLLEVVQAAHVPRFLVKKLFQQARLGLSAIACCRVRLPCA